MIDTLVSLLITKLGYVRIQHFAYEHVGLVEFFDQVLVAADEPKLCLIKRIDDMTMDEIDHVTRFGLEIAERSKERRNLRYQTLVFLVAEEGIDREKALKLSKLPAFCITSHYRPVIANGSSRTLSYKPFKLPFFFLLQVVTLARLLKQPITFPYPGVSDLGDEEKKTIKRMEGLHKALHGFRPYMTWSLIALNLVLWIIFTLAYPQNPHDTAGLIRFGAKVNPLIWEGQFWRLLTAAFIHSGTFHLVSNSILIFFLGPTLEALYGRRRFLLIYLVAAVTGNLMSVACTPFLSIGSSSALFGLPGALALYAWRYRNEVPRHFHTILIMVLFFFFSFILMLAGVPLSTADHYSHMGGLIGGFLVAGLLGVRFPGNEPRKFRWQPVISAVLFFSVLLWTAMKPNNSAYSFYYRILGEQQAVAGNYTQAISYLEFSRSLDTTQQYSGNVLGEVYNQVASRYIKKQMPDIALHYFQKAETNLDRDGRNQELLAYIYTQMGNCYDDKYNNREAIKHYQYALVLKPYDGQLKEKIAGQFLILARQALLEGKLTEAETFTRYALWYVPGDVDAGILLGRLEYLRGNFMKAAVTWQALIKKDTKAYRTDQFLQGNIFAVLLESAAAWQTVAGEEPETSRVKQLLRKNIFITLWYPEPGKKKKSRYNDAAVQLNADGEKILQNSGDYEKAHVAFQQASSLDPGYPEPLNNQARIALMLGNIEEAKELVKKSLDLDDKNGVTRTLYGAVLFESGQKNKAQEVLMMNQQLNPKRAESFALLGEIHRINGDPQEAIVSFGKAVKLAPDNVVWRIMLARMYRDAGNREKFWQESNTALVLILSQNRHELEPVVRTMLSETR